MRKLYIFPALILTIISAGCQTGRIDPLARSIDKQAAEDIYILAMLQTRCRHLLDVDYSYSLAQTLRDDIVASVEIRNIPWLVLDTTLNDLDHAIEKARQKEEALALAEVTAWRDGCPLAQIDHWAIRSAVISQATNLKILGLTPTEFAVIDTYFTAPTSDNQVAQEI